MSKVKSQKYQQVFGTHNYLKSNEMGEIREANKNNIRKWFRMYATKQTWIHIPQKPIELKMSFTCNKSNGKRCKQKIRTTKTFTEKHHLAKFWNLECYVQLLWQFNRIEFHCLCASMKIEFQMWFGSSLEKKAFYGEMCATCGWHMVSFVDFRFSTVFDRAKWIRKLSIAPVCKNDTYVLLSRSCASSKTSLIEFIDTRIGILRNQCTSTKVFAVFIHWACTLFAGALLATSLPLESVQLLLLVVICFLRVQFQYA